jgi:hypothetical protein
VDNKRVLVDVERGRTVPNWRPRRLGGGLGSSRMGGADADKKDSTRYMCFLILITCRKLLLLERGTGVKLITNAYVFALLLHVFVPFVFDMLFCMKPSVPSDTLTHDTSLLMLKVATFMLTLAYLIIRGQQHGGRPRSEEPRRDDRRADR